MVNFVQRTGSANPFNGVPVRSNSFPTFVDVDKDGDLDAFLSTYGTIRYYRNNSGTLGELTGTQNPFTGVTNAYIPPTFADVDQDGDLDAFLPTNDTIRSYRNNSGTLGELTGTQNPFTGVTGVNTSPIFADVDKDGDLDAFLSTYNNSSYVYTIRSYRNNSGTLGELTGTQNPFTGVTNAYTPPTFADVDQDGDLDAFLNASGTIRPYRNNSGTLGELTGTQNPFTGVTGVNTSPIFADVDKDGDLDAFLSTYNNSSYVYTIRSYRNNSGTLGELTGTQNPFTGVSGVYNPPIFTDVDGDGDLDAFLNASGTIRPYRNNSGTLGELTGTQNPFNSVSGVYNPPTFADVDGDGDLDAFIAEDYGTIKYFQNTTPVVTIPAVTIAPGTTPSEQNPNTPGTFVLTLSTPAPSGGLTINYTVGGGSATSGVDYQPLTGSVIIPPGATRGIIPVTPIRDNIPEVTENISVSLRTGTGYSIGATSTAILGITNFSAAPVLAKNASIAASQNSAVVITNALLQATDDNTPAQLVYTLTSLPSNGTLKLNGNPLAVNSTFTQDDINKNRLIYQHNGSSTTSDGFRFTLSDGIAPTTTRLSVAGTVIQGNNASYIPSISADGRYVTFESDASNLVSGDTNNTRDIFVRDLAGNTTTPVSVVGTGIAGNNGNSFNPSISADGRYVTFESDASNLVSGDTNGTNDIFVRDLAGNTTTRVSVAGTGIAGNNGKSLNPSVSADGRYVTFQSQASNLVSGDTNGTDDIFVRDLAGNTTTRVSVDSTGNQGNSQSYNPSISADGRYVTFDSHATNLVSGDTNNNHDIFVRDLAGNTTTRVSLDSTGNQGDGGSYNPSRSADGRYVTFESDARNLVSGDTNNSRDIFVRDLVNNTTSRVSLDSTGNQGNTNSYNPSISADGRYVTFLSYATNLVSGNTNGTGHIFVRDLVGNTTTRVSVDGTGKEGNSASLNPSISADGRYVTFQSDARNLVSEDTNGRTDIFVRDLGVSGNSIAGNSVITINAAPTDVSLSANRVDENVVANTVIGTFSTTDPNVGNTFAYTLVDGTGSTDNNTFSIVNGNQLSINTSPNYEAKSSYNIRVRTRDSGGLSYQKALTINVNNVNETPTLATPIADQTTVAGSAFNYTLPETTFSDVDRDTLIYTATTPSWLTFNPTTRTFSGTPSSSNEGVAEIQVTASDRTLSVSDTFNLTIFPATPPSVTLSLNNASITENGSTLVTATLAWAIASDVTIDLGFGGDVTSSDYNLSDSQIIIGAGNTTGSITLTGLDDDLVESNETISIDILNVTNAAELNNQQVTAIILDNDTTPISDTPGDDTIPGTSNNDTIALTGGNNIIRANNGNDIVTGATGSDRFYGDPGSDVLNGGEGDDTLDGGIDNDTLLGEAGNDRLYGGDGNDRLFGGVGSDRLYGDTGNDLLDGNVGTDTLVGGNGADIFVLRPGDGRDTIQDYSDGTDKIGLAGGLNFGRLQLESLTNPSLGTYTRISDRTTSETLALLLGVSSSNLTTIDFVSV